jgi:hypothetical protein
MALAILDLVGLDDASTRFRIDTGTNRYYQLKIGRSLRSRSGVDVIDEVVFQTPLSVNEAGGSLLDSSTEISVPSQRLERGRGYAQLFSFKTRDGRAPGFSPVLRLQRGLGMPDATYSAPESSQMHEVMDAAVAPFQPARTVACRTTAQQFSAPALGDLLTELVRVAGPVVMGLLANGQAAATGSMAPASAAGAVQPDALARVLQAVLKAIPGLGGPALSAGTSLQGGPSTTPSRFANGNGRGLSQPFIFGIDDALVSAAIGQFVAMLPQLMNAANQQRIQLRQGHNKLVGDIVDGVQRRMLLDQVLDAQRQAPAGQNADLTKLAELLQQMPAPAAAPPASAAAAPAAVATVQSVSPVVGYHATLSSRAVVAFVTAPPVRWNGTDQVVFPSGQPLQVKLKLVVGEPVPKTPLPKAIIRVVVKDSSDQSVFAEQVVKQKDLSAGAVVAVSFTAADLATVPAGKPVSVLAEIRWLGSGGAERKALGSTEIAFVDRYFVKERGAAVGPQRELTDMNRYRPFWNKVWESPALDAAAGSDRKLLWELDANLRYAVLLVPEHTANGLMETKLLVAAGDADSVAVRTEGRMKGGIELSLEEMSKLAPLWEGEQVLAPEKLEAFRSTEYARANASELVYRLKLKGRAAERGLVWVVPVFALVDFTLGCVQSTDDSGQVAAIAEEPVRLPLPVAVRIIGLKSGAEPASDDEADAPADGSVAEPEYRFDGYEVELSEKIVLTPAAGAVPGAGHG